MFRTIHTREELEGRTGVYKITLRDTQRHYIGQARDLLKRMRSHVREAHSRSLKVKRKIHTAILKYGADAFDFTVLVYCEPKELNAWEAKFIADFRGVEDGFNRRRSPETIARLKLARNNRAPVSEERKAEIRAIMSAAHKGKKVSEETREKHRKNLLGKKLPPHWREALQRHAATRKVPVEQYTKLGCFIASYPSVSEAAKATGVHVGNLVSALKGRLKTTGGFIWKYASALVN